jgi:hypothetical protein
LFFDKKAAAWLRMSVSPSPPCLTFRLF